MRTNTTFFQGFVSSFFIQPFQFMYRTRHHQPLVVGSLVQDWQNLGNDFHQASQQMIEKLDKPQQKQLNHIRYVSKTT